MYLLDTDTVSNFLDRRRSHPQLRIRILTIPDFLIETAAAISQQTGLLSNDSLIVAIMQHHGLTKLASEDADFDVVPGILRYAPT